MSCKRHDRTHGRRPGVAAVELALLLPLLAFLLMICIDFGRVFYYSLTIENCARNGAIYGCDPYNPTQSIYTSVSDAALADATDLQPQPTVTSTTGKDSSGNPYVECTVSWTFNSLTNYPGIPSTTNLTRTVRMRIAPQTPN